MTARTGCCIAALLAAGAGAVPGTTRAQVAPGDTLALGALYDSAALGDPRARQIALLAAQSQLRQRNLSAELAPALSVEGLAQYQSDVPRVPITVPGVSLPTPSNEVYDARIAATERLVDFTLRPRRALERAQLAESQARTRVSLYALRQQVNEAFFTALRAQEQIAEIELGIADLEAQREVATRRVREGAALPSEENALRAELLRRHQARAEAASARRAALEVLADLTGARVDSATVLRAPDLRAETEAARSALRAGDGRGRPELAQFARARDVLTGQESVRRAQDLPTVSAFGRIGYGRPGLNPLNDTFDSYWLAGVQLQWTPWTWGTTGREREVLAVQRQIVAADEQAFQRQLGRAAAQDLAAIDRLEEALGTDEEIIALRERIAAETRTRYAEGAVTSAEYIDRQTDALGARTARALHRVELAQSRARLLTTLGIEVP